MVDAKADWVRQILERYEAPLVRYACGIVGEIECARDVVQDTFLMLCRQDPGQIGDYVVPWLYKVCRNRALDVRRKENPMQPLEETDLNTRASRNPGPSALFEHKEALEQALGIIAGLPPAQREVLLLKLEGDLSYKQIAEITGLSSSNVGFILHTAIQKIRERMKTPAEVPPAKSAIRRIQ